MRRIKMQCLSRLIVLFTLLFTAACTQHQAAYRQDGDGTSQTQFKALSEGATPAAMADDVLFRAIDLVGTPYRYGGNTPETGFDCSGLIGFVYAETLGLKLPRNTAQMMQVKAPVIARNALRSGDIVFFATSGGRRVSHAGIYVGDGRFVHAPSSGGVVRLDSLDNQYWKKTYLQGKRFISE